MYLCISVLSLYREMSTKVIQKGAIIFTILLTFFVVPSNLLTIASGYYPEESENLAIPDNSDSLRFEKRLHQLYNEISGIANLDFKVFRYSVVGFFVLKNKGLIKNDSLITIIDYEQPSDAKRLFVINLSSKKLVYNTLVAHGKNTGEVYATNFSNRPKSNKSCFGFFVTGETYNGKHEFSLKLDGVDTLYNHKARQRGIVFHGAEYVSEDYIQWNGRLGRSYGCPAVPQSVNQNLINTIRGGSCLFMYYEDPDYLSETNYLNLEIAIREFIDSQLI